MYTTFAWSLGACLVCTVAAGQVSDPRSGRMTDPRPLVTGDTGRQPVNRLPDRPTVRSLVDTADGRVQLNQPPERHLGQPGTRLTDLGGDPRRPDRNLISGRPGEGSSRSLFAPPDASERPNRLSASVLEAHTLSATGGGRVTVPPVPQALNRSGFVPDRR